MPEEEIDLNVEASFPASDPPSWTVGTDHRGAASRGAPPENQRDDERARRQRRIP
jgi:hypothetical protein